MATAPDGKAVGDRPARGIDVPLGELTWQFRTKAAGRGGSVSPAVAAPVGSSPRRVDGLPPPHAPLWAASTEYVGSASSHVTSPEGP
jgi:hypothetical protein